MKSFRLTIFLLVVTASLNHRANCQDAEPLFNGQDLAGWYGNNPHTTKKFTDENERFASIALQQQEFLNHWRVANGELINDGEGPYATTTKSYGDIELTLEYKTVALADSGIYLKGAPQVQIWDTTEAGGKWNRNADKGSGSLYNNSEGAAGQLPLVHADRPFGAWNRLKIVQVGSRTSVTFNDQLVVDNAIMENYWDESREQPLPARGPIYLQTHGGEIRWRNIKLRQIAPSEAITILRGGDEHDGFKAIFNGTDLSGWQGALDGYEVVDGAIRSRPTGGGVLYTNDEYADFVVRLEFLLPPGGNNGLAIRYPGSGDAAYTGMAEIQVLDKDAEQYDRLDARQLHGSAYGMVGAHRGYLRPAGEWNYQEVTVQGSRVKVELNGFVVLDEDLALVEAFLANKPHPGRSRTSGHFGFCGHNSPVMFRNIAIKKLTGSHPDSQSATEDRLNESESTSR